jgi:exosortase/archaeosortase family protein
MKTPHSPTRSSTTFFDAGKAASWLLLGPVAQTILLVDRFQRLFGVRLLPADANAYDYICPAIFATFLLLLVWMKTEKVALRLQKKILGANLVLFGLLMGVTEIFSGSPVFFVAWLVAALAVIGSAFFLFVEPTYYFRHSERRMIFPALLLGCSTFISNTAVYFLSKPLTWVTGRIVYGVVRLFSPVSYKVVEMPSAPEATRIVGSQLTMLVVWGCSGLQGISFFLLAFTFIYLLKPRLFRRKEWGAFFLLGVTYVFCLNAVRISFLFLMSEFVFNRPSVLFHDSIGWVIYSVGIYFYFRWIYRERNLPARDPELEGSRPRTGEELRHAG